jgi:hypothetical protein
MVFQPADELHGALCEPLDGLPENGHSATSLAFGLLVALGRSPGLAPGPGLVVDARLAKDLLFHGWGFLVPMLDTAAPDKPGPDE